MEDKKRIKKIAKIGVGTQGSAVAWACAVNGIDVNLYMRTIDKTQRARDKLKEQILDTSISGLPRKKAEEAIARLHITPDLEEALSDVDLAFESVYEDLEYKKKVHADIGKIAPPQVLIGSNMSSLLCTPLAEASGRPDKFFCMNWGDPRHKQWFVMVMWNMKTSESTKELALGWARNTGMLPVIANKDTPGYGFNKVWREVKRECLALWADGVFAPFDMDRYWILCFGTRIGPFAMMDEIGLDTIRDVEMQYYNASCNECDKPPQKLFDMIEAGKLGKKNGKGFYSYPNPDYEKEGWLYKKPPFDK